MKSDERRQKQEAAGIPDSKPFIDPATAHEPSRIETCHINGVLIADLHLDPQVLAALDYWASDEGIAEREAHPMARPSSGVELGKDPFAKALDQKRDDVKRRGMPARVARDPFKEVADRFAKPGMEPKFMSAKAVQDGYNQDHVVVKHPNGDPVKVRGMVLGHIPTDVRAEILAENQARGNQFLRQMTEEYQKTGGETAVVDK